MKIITTTPNYLVQKTFGIDQSNWDAPEHLAIGQISMDRLFRTVALEAGSSAAEFAVGSKALDVEGLAFEDPFRPEFSISGEQFLNRRLFNDALLVMHKGQVVHESYRNGMRPNDRHVIHSCTKSLCGMIVSMAVDEGLLDPGAPISKYVSAFEGRAEWQGVTLQHVSDMQAGIEYSEDYADPEAHYWRYARAAGYYPPLPGEEAVGAKAWVIANLNKRARAPGSAFSYNSCLANVLGMALEHVYERGLAEIFEEKLYGRVGAESDAHFNTDPQGFPIVEGQMNLTLQDFARCAYPIANGGKSLTGEQLLTPGFIDGISMLDAPARQAYQALEPDTVFPTGQYKDQFWGLDTDQRQFAMLGIHGQFAWFDLNKDLMIVGLGSYPQQDGDGMMMALKSLWTTIANAT